MKPPLGSPALPRTASENHAEPAHVASPAESGGTAPGPRARPPLGSPNRGVRENFVPVSAEILDALDEQESRESRRFPGHEKDSPTGLAKFSQFKVLAGSVTLLFGTGILAILGLIVFSQSLAAISFISQLPYGLRILSWAVLAALLAAILIPVVRLAGKLVRFRRAQQIDLLALEQLDARHQLRVDSSEQKTSVIAELDRYLDDYPDPHDTLAPLGIEEEFVEELQSQLVRLRNRERNLGEDAWIRDFELSFHATLEKIAKGRIHAHALKVAVGAGLSPFPLVDSLIVLNSGFRMIDDLCTIYNLRMGKWPTVFVLLLATSQSILAGKVEDSEALDKVGDELLHPVLTRLGLGAAEAIAKPVIGMAGQGLLHYLLLRRIGVRTQRWLRVVKRND